MIDESIKIDGLMHDALILLKSKTPFGDKSIDNLNNIIGPFGLLVHYKTSGGLSHYELLGGKITGYRARRTMNGNFLKIFVDLPVFHANCKIIAITIELNYEKAVSNLVFEQDPDNLKEIEFTIFFGELVNY